MKKIRESMRKFNEAAQKHDDEWRDCASSKMAKKEIFKSVIRHVLWNKLPVTNRCLNGLLIKPEDKEKDVNDFSESFIKKLSDSIGDKFYELSPIGFYNRLSISCEEDGFGMNFECKDLCSKL